MTVARSTPATGETIPLKAMRILVAILLAAVLPAGLPARTRHRRATPRASSVAADRLGLTCPQILAMNSTGWVAKFDKDKGAASERAIAAYGKCYEDRTERLAELLARKRAGPPKRALSDFLSFEDAVKNFTQTAFAGAQSPPDSVKLAYIALYEKQFRYDFYRQYQQKNLNPPLSPDQDLQFTKAKNRFGELIGLLPSANAHQVHGAFGEIVGTHEISMAMKLALYRYAIFILEPPPPEKPFAPPPF